MNEIQRKVKLLRMADIIGVSPAAVRICGKERLIPWTVGKNDHCFYLTVESISDPTPVPIATSIQDMTISKSYGCGDAKLLESQKWILPRFEKIKSIHILDAAKKYLVVEMWWIVDVTKFHTPESGRKKNLPRTAGTTNGVWRIFRNRLPERILMNCTKNKDFYRRLCNCEYEPFNAKFTKEKRALLTEIFKGTPTRKAKI